MPLGINKKQSVMFRKMLLASVANTVAAIVLMVGLSSCVEAESICSRLDAMDLAGQVSTHLFPEVG